MNKMKRVLLSSVAISSLLLFSGCDFASGDTWKGKVYNTVTSPHTGKIWLDRNLGASKVCSSYKDKACFGDYYQWGREADGHEKKSSGVTSIFATSISNINNKFIKSSSKNNYDWTKNTDKDGSLRSNYWSLTDGSGICPSGFRVPTSAELKAETTTHGVRNRQTAFSNFLKIPSAGARNYLSATVQSRGHNVSIWSSSVKGSKAMSLFVGHKNALISRDGYRAVGKAVRCIKD